MRSSPLHPMVRINYRIRAGSFAYSFVVLAIHGWERGLGPLYWIALALQFLVYPHLVYLLARRARDPRRAEQINLYADAAFLGVWIGALHFPLWLAYAALFSTTLNATVVFGVKRGLWAVVVFGAAAALGLALAGFRVLEHTSTLVTALCFLGSFAYSCAVGGVAHTLREHLRESEGRYRLLADNAADLVAIVDLDSRWIYASPSFEAVLDRAHVTPGGNALERLHPDDAERVRLAVLRSASTGRARELTLRLVDRNGRMREYKASVQPVKGEPSPATRIVLALRDVTDLRESEERLLIAGHALEGMTEAIMITSADGYVRTVNRAFSEITGIGRDEAIGQPEQALRSNLVTTEFYDEVYAAVQRDGHWSGTCWNRRKNGSVYREWRSVRVVKDAAGAVTYYVHVFYEVGSPRNGARASAHDAKAG